MIDVDDVTNQGVRKVFLSEGCFSFGIGTFPLQNIGECPPAQPWHQLGADGSEEPFHLTAQLWLASRCARCRNPKILGCGDQPARRELHSGIRHQSLRNATHSPRRNRSHGIRPSALVLSHHSQRRNGDFRSDVPGKPHTKNAAGRGTYRDTEPHPLLWQIVQLFPRGCIQVLCSTHLGEQDDQIDPPAVHDDQFKRPRCIRPACTHRAELPVGGIEPVACEVHVIGTQFLDFFPKALARWNGQLGFANGCAPGILFREQRPHDRINRCIVWTVLRQILVYRPHHEVLGCRLDPRRTICVCRRTQSHQAMPHVAGRPPTQCTS